MGRDWTEESAARARWLAELAEALARAQDLAWQLGESGCQESEAMDVYTLLEAARVEVRSLQIRMVPSRGSQNDPKWLKSPWCPPEANSS